MSGIEDFQIVFPDLISVALTRGIDLQTISGPSGFLKNGRFLTFWRESGVISYSLQGGVRELPKAFAKSADVFHGAYAEAGDCADLEEAVNLIVAWLFDCKDADYLPKRITRKCGIG